MSAFDCGEVCNVNCEKDVDEISNVLINSSMLLAFKEVIAVVVAILVYFIIGYIKKDTVRWMRMAISAIIGLVVYYVLSSRVSEIKNNAEDMKGVCMDFKQQCNCDNPNIIIPDVVIPDEVRMNLMRGG